MPKVAKGQRKRAYRPKTTSGCLTCKVRRVKCDEGRPDCLRCISTGRACGGYNNAQAPRSPSSNIVSIIAGPSSDILASSQSHRSFSFFVQRTSPQLAGFFGSDFWERLVLQTAYHEPAVRHAVVAVGTLHELFERQTVMTDTSKAFALEQYNLAIKDLLFPQPQGGTRGVDVCLITCILFICFENMQWHHASAGSHIRSGTKLLREAIYDERNGITQHQTLKSKILTNSYASPEVLARIFAGLDSQTTLVVDRDKFKLHEKAFSGVTYDDVSLSFSTIEEAKNIFEYGRSLFINNHAIQLSCDPVNPHVTFEAHINRCATLLSKFLLALQNFAELKRPFLTQKEDIAISVLRLHTLSANVSLHVEHLPPNYPPQWDKVISQTKEILVLGEKIILSTASSNNYGAQITSFCLDMGIIIPLYTVASQCQDPSIRRKAIALLRSTSRQEGLWNSLLVAKAAERIMEIEESILEERCACAHYPGLARSSNFKPFLELDAKGGRLRYIQHGQGAFDYRNVVEEIFHW
ncbi:hypothetical protein BGZ60DRAFT_533025 [Tricladium varicosporioides]|nr:hypothetical protein BGZ60DRAFT_533025 [Hymenoscyphus varicosporioides]